MVAALISAALQVGAVLLVALLVYWIFGRGADGFARYLGLYRASPAALGLALVWGLAGAALMLALPGMREAAGGTNSVAGTAAAHGCGGAVVGVLAIKALLQTSLSEELLFRGLIGKRLIARFGFASGNAVQAALFGLGHLLLLLIPQASTMLVLAVVLFTGISGWVNGWLNERMGGGSILPGWVAHGSANLSAYLAVACFV